MCADERATHPTSTVEAMQAIMANFENLAGSGGASGSSGTDDDTYVDPEDTDAIKQAKRQTVKPEAFTYTERDVMLYNLGCGAKADELQWVYEGGEGFAVRC